MQYLLTVDIEYGVLDQEYSVLADVIAMGHAQAQTLVKLYLSPVHSILHSSMLLCCGSCTLQPRMCTFSVFMIYFLLLQYIQY